MAPWGGIDDHAPAERTGDADPANHEVVGGGSKQRLLEAHLPVLRVEADEPRGTLAGAVVDLHPLAQADLARQPQPGVHAKGLPQRGVARREDVAAADALTRDSAQVHRDALAGPARARRAGRAPGRRAPAPASPAGAAAGALRARRSRTTACRSRTVPAPRMVKTRSTWSTLAAGVARHGREPRRPRARARRATSPTPAPVRAEQASSSSLPGSSSRASRIAGSGSARSALVTATTPPRTPSARRTRTCSTRLRHDAVVGGDDEQEQVDAGRARDHHAHETLVAGDVDHRQRPPAGEAQRRVARARS